MSEIMDSASQEELRNIENPGNDHECDYRLAEIHFWKISEMESDEAFDANFKIFTLRCDCGKILTIKSNKMEIK